MRNCRNAGVPPVVAGAPFDFAQDKPRPRLIEALLLAAVLLLASCSKQTPVEASSIPTSPASAFALPVAADSVPVPIFNTARAWKYVKEVVAFGARPIGSADHKKLEDYILSHLKGDQVEDDAFVADTPEGKFPVRNIIAKYPGTKDGLIVIAGHYDTNYPLRNTGYVGANDGGSSTAVLLEFANQLRGKTREGYTVWLVWTDGEEAVKTWSATDSVYGTRHLADKWQKDGTLKKIKAFLLADMIADADLNIERDMNSTPWLEDLVLQAATNLGYQSHFFGRTGAIDDDHLPFVHLGVPVADFIDLDYGYNNVFHHTPQDTMDKLSPKSMEIVGSVMLETVRLLDAK
jgi:Zn-dependent M28 family amino/carboxypeptidase